jgi:non-ribosomal peptide synthetase component F
MLNKDDISRLRFWNGTPPIEEDNCIHELIKRCCLSQPGAAAVCAWDGDLSYWQLDQLSSQLAAQLVSRGAGPDSIVAALFNKSKWTPVTVLAILKAGGAFVLLDPAYPLLRLRQTCETLGTKLIVCSNTLAAMASSLGPEVFLVGTEQLLPGTSTATIEGSVGLSSRSLAYVVFTSGSTGRPKGVQISHRSFCSMARPYID